MGILFYLFFNNLRLSKIRNSHHDEGRKEEVFYLTTLSTHFIYGYMASDIW